MDPTPSAAHQGPASVPGELLPDITSDEGVESFDDRHYLEQRPPHHG
ncbi:MAG: hypothetical protein ACR2KE_05765 [Candidatus Nanopelagicales bacterium]